jgi:hydrogenase maturation factor HypF (carbamoyltransferase family)
MAFFLELDLTTTQPYIQNYIKALANKYEVALEFSKETDKLICEFDNNNQNLQPLLEELSKLLPASLFLKGAKNYTNDKEVTNLDAITPTYPISLGLCPSCQKDMFDVTSRRYYYPFSSCSCCGGAYSFFNSYPYKRENTSFKYIVPCDECQEEMKKAGLRQNHQINSCHKCGVPVRLMSKKSERYANDAGSFRTMFEVAAKAINDGKKVLIKTTMGYRVFYKVDKYLNKDTILMMIEADKITDNLSLITEEFNALLSIERPVLHVALKNEKLKEIMGYNTAFVKYPDDGFSILLGVELKKLGFEYVGYEVADENTEADFKMEYDLEITPQEDIRYFINKDIGFIVSGERVAFPYKSEKKSDVLSIAYSLSSVEVEDGMLFDRMNHFKDVHPSRVHHVGELKEIHPKQFKIDEDEASFMSVIVEHNLEGQKCVGAYFGNTASFLYYNGKNVIRAVPPNNFNTKTLIEDIKNLREGSDRLVENLKKQLPEIYQRLELLQEKEEANLFEAVAIILDIEDKTYRGLTKEAMKFTGKGGIQIDTQVVDNKFNYTALVASIISYKLAGVSNVIISYSFFESFGDYFNDILQQINAKTKASHFIICGESFGNQSLFSRMARNLKMNPAKLNKNLPIGRYNAVVGGAYL